MNSLIRALSFITKYSSSIVVMVLSCTLPTQAKDHPQKNTKNILFIAGDTKHRHGFHEYKAGSILLADALNKSGLPVQPQVHWYGWLDDETIFNDVDACIIYADVGGVFGEKYAFLDRKVKAGMGIMFMH